MSFFLLITPLLLIIFCAAYLAATIYALGNWKVRTGLGCVALAGFIYGVFTLCPRIDWSIVTILTVLLAGAIFYIVIVTHFPPLVPRRCLIFGTALAALLLIITASVIIIWQHFKDPYHENITLNILTMLCGLFLFLIICATYPVAIIAQWKARHRLIFSVMLAVPLLVTGAFALADEQAAKREYPEFLGAVVFDTVPIYAEKTLFHYNSDRSFNGDGFSLDVYELPPAIRQQFSPPDDKLLHKYPQENCPEKDPYHGKDWHTVKWTQTPLLPGAQKIVDFALSDADSNFKEASGLKNISTISAMP